MKKNMPAPQSKAQDIFIVHSDNKGFKSDESLKSLSPLMAIKAYCKDCSGNSVSEVKLCPRDGVHSFLCPLYRYRQGKTGRSRNYSDEQRKKMAQNLQKARNARFSDSTTDFFSLTDSDEVITHPNASKEGFDD